MDPQWIDLTIPREHRAMMVITAEKGWSPISDLPALIAPLKCRAHFLQRRLNADPEKADFCFEVSWRQPERSTPPLHLLTVVSERYPVNSFELTSENGADACCQEFELLATAASSGAGLAAACHRRSRLAD